MSFWLDVKVRRRILDPNLRKKELSKPMEDFSKLEHMSMFCRPLWFAYRGLERLEKVTK